MNPPTNTSLTLFRMDFFEAAHGWGGGEGVQKSPLSPSPENLLHISYSYETWHSYTLAIEDPTNTLITFHTT